MKNISEIKRLTLVSQKEQAEKARILAEKMAETNRIEKEKYIRDVKKYCKEIVTKNIPELIEAAAKSGNSSCNFEMRYFSAKDKDFEFKTFKEYVEKNLSDFNPEFWNEEHWSCDHNYDGDSIAGTERRYYVPNVKFSW